MKVTRKNLENLMKAIANCKPDYEDWELEYCSVRGYEITRNNGMSNVKNRGTARETRAFLEGVLEVVGY